MILRTGTIAASWIILAGAVGKGQPGGPVDLGNLPPSEQNLRGRQLYSRVLTDPRRDAWQMPDQVVTTLAFKPAETVVVIGDGDAYLSRRIAPLTSQVVIIDDDVKKLQKANLEDEDNVQTSVSSLQNIVVPISQPQTILIYNELAEIPNRQMLFLLLAAALHPTGRIVVIDFYKNLPSGLPPAQQITAGLITSEMQGAGLRLVNSFSFLPSQFFLIFQH